jgi:hypothetical protein
MMMVLMLFLSLRAKVERPASRCLFLPKQMRAAAAEVFQLSKQHGKTATWIAWVF